MMCLTFPRAPNYLMVCLADVAHHLTSAYSIVQFGLHV